MGTRGLIEIMHSKFENDEDKASKALCTLYNHWDSYPEGLGKELADFLKQVKIVNGFNLGDPNAPKMAANGMGDLAAQIICVIKNPQVGPRPGSVSVIPTGHRDCCEEYVYQIYEDEATNIPFLRAMEVGYSTEENTILFDGNPNDYEAWLKMYLKAEEDENDNPDDGDVGEIGIENAEK